MCVVRIVTAVNILLQNYPGVRVISGFANQRPWDGGATMTFNQYPTFLDTFLLHVSILDYLLICFRNGISRHYYVGGNNLSTSTTVVGSDGDRYCQASIYPNSTCIAPSSLAFFVHLLSFLLFF